MARPIARFIRVTGTLNAQEQAEVAAEVAGRVVATPVERGTPVAAGNLLVQIAANDPQAQVAEAQANAAQIEAGLGMADGQPFALDRVPDVVNTKAAYDLAQADFARLKTLLDQKVISQAEYDRSFANVESARQRYEMARNTASQQVQALQAARARVTRASKALADTAVKAPFAGLVAERLVSIGDFVTPGTKVAVVVRVDPLRVELTVPEQFVSVVGVGRPVSLQVDAYPGRTFTAHVRYISPALSAATRALIVEAVVANPTGELKPGFFATAQIEQAEQTTALLAPAAAVTTVSGTARVFVVAGDHAEERIVTTGQGVDDLVELTTGVTADEQVILTQGPQLVDGVRIAATGATAATPAGAAPAKQ
ncbi:MAG TPA: efflux RND transporter periplasmic adaptor subunit [Vicinamibacterales bacterium]|nr:efflux RND transporter periplasmic adaptor subunit [Vicinamibacterales bacterium]